MPESTSICFGIYNLRCKVSSSHAKAYWGLELERLPGGTAHKGDKLGCLLHSLFVATPKHTALLPLDDALYDGYLCVKEITAMGNKKAHEEFMHGESAGD